MNRAVQDNYTADLCYRKIRAIYKLPSLKYKALLKYYCDQIGVSVPPKDKVNKFLLDQFNSETSPIRKEIKIPWHRRPWRKDKSLNKKPKKLNKKEAYLEFLKSDYWKEVRELILKRDDRKCIHCSGTKILQVHHKTYKNHGEEHLHLDDLITLCRACHKKIHKRKAID